MKAKKRRVPSFDERQIRPLCDELDRLHRSHDGLRVEGFVVARPCPIPVDQMSGLWSLVHSQHAEDKDEDVGVIPERWRHTDDNIYCYRFFGDIVGCDEFMDLEREAVRILNMTAGSGAVTSSVFFAGAVALRCQVPLLSANVHNVHFDSVTVGFGPFVEGCGLSLAKLPEVVLYRLRLIRDPFLSLKAALEWVINPSAPHDAPDVWKRLVSEFPHTGLIERLLSSGKAPAGKRSWTQPDLDKAILEYQAHRAPRFNELVAAVKAGDKNAKKAAQDTFGRNAIVRELGVRAPAMVSRSPSWIAIAEALGIKRSANGCPATLRKRRGIAIAVEQVSEELSCDPATDVELRDAVEYIRRKLGRDEDLVVREALIEDVRAGKIALDDVEATVNAYHDQQQDDRNTQRRRRSDAPTRGRA